MEPCDFDSQDHLERGDLLLLPVVGLILGFWAWAAHVFAPLVVHFGNGHRRSAAAPEADLGGER